MYINLKNLKFTLNVRIIITLRKQQNLFVHDFVAISARYLLLFVNTSPYPNDRAVQLIFLSALCLYGRPTFFITRTLSTRVWFNQTVINFAYAIEITWHHMQLMVDGLYYLTNFTFCTNKLISIITLIFIPDFALTITKPPSIWITGVCHNSQAYSLLS